MALSLRFRPACVLPFLFPVLLAFAGIQPAEWRLPAHARRCIVF
jgi:hypothetical protein